MSEDLKQTAQLRKAIMPLIGLLKAEANDETARRLDAIEAIVKEIAKKDTTVNVTVETEELTESIKKFAAPEPIDPPSTYEPHDQAKNKGGTFQYSGFVRSDGAYYIQRVTKGEQRYARGKSGYATAWENRDRLKYGYINGDK